MPNIEGLIKQMIAVPVEQPWLEFKENNGNQDMIGEDISALANAAAYYERSHAYMIWGVRDSDHAIVGTSFDPQEKKIGNQPLEIWLRTQLSEHTEYEFFSETIDHKTIVVLIITRAAERTVMFKKTEYIRVGSCTKKLNEVPSMKMQLWDHLRSTRFEELSSQKDLNLAEALQRLDYSVYFDLQKAPIPSDSKGIAHFLQEDRILIQQDDGQYAISNLGAILFAKNLNWFPTVARKAARVVQYRGENRMEMLREMSWEKGYAVGYENLIQFIEAMLPASEIIEDGIRRTELSIPSIAIRESIANALIHQDFSIRGTGPLIEIFSNRVEITNPGQPLVDIFRIVDNPPRSRNEKLAALMRRFHICEESGTGWDKIILSSELYHLPSPRIDVYEDNTRVTLYAYKPFSDILAEERLLACYFHACIRFVEGKQMNNTSLRERFGLDETFKSQISRLMKQAVEKQMIKAFDPETAPRYMRYVPIWA